MSVLALDVGTSTIKAAVLGPSVGPIARVSYDLDHPTPDAAEINPAKLWHALTEAATKAASGQKVEALGLSCLMPTLVLLGDHDQLLGPAWTHLDRRARPAARAVEADCGPQFLAACGNRPLPGGVSAVCFKQRVADEPGLLKQVRRYLHLHGWLGLKLTGRAAFEPGNACFSGLYEPFRPDPGWSARWCRYFGVDPAWLPEVLDGRTVLGGLLPEVAKAWGLPAGLPVRLGVADTSSAMLAAELRPGDLLHNVGTTQVLAVLADAPRPDPRRLTRRLGVGPGFIHVTHNPVGGAALDWLYDLCFRDLPKSEFFGSVVPGALDRPTAVTLDPPFLGGDRLEIEARQAALRGLTTGTDRLDVLAAVLVAMRQGHRAAFAALDLQRPLGRVYLTGGAAPVVRKLLAEYADADVYFLDEAALLGVAHLFR